MVGMILSEEVVKDSRLPDFIRLSSAFKGKKQYPKIFTHLGLSNFKCKVSDVPIRMPFAIGAALNGIKIDTQDFRCSKFKKALYTALGVPLFISESLLSLAEAKKFKKLKEKQALNVVFSAEGTEGAWDIATMSMRGIESCQSWYSRRAHHLIGSITDPCCAVMYLEDPNDSMGHGTRMLYRTVVRYVVHEEFGPYLFMEQLYPYTNDEFETNAVMVLFALLLQQKTKLNVLYRGCALRSENVCMSLFIPTTDAVVNNSYSASYRDSRIPYKSASEFIEKFPSLNTLKEKFFN
jgi:hypothetical protein